MQDRERRMDGNAPIMDLEGADDDLIGGAGGDAALMQVSPPQVSRQASGVGAGVAGAGGAGAAAVDFRTMPKIRVVVRKRPLNSKERDRGEEDVVEVEPEAGGLVVNETKTRVDLTKYVERHQFKFDCTLGEDVNNEQVYQATVRPLVETLFHQGRSTVFAYGQTGSGKTYTMQPLPSRTARDILARLAAGAGEGQGLSLWVAYFEIYGGKVFDLLNGRQRIVIREDSRKKVNVVGLQEHHVTSVPLVEQLLEHGNAARSTGSTGANADSSRSHAIMQFCLKREGADGLPGPVVGKVSLVARGEGGRQRAGGYSLTPPFPACPRPSLAHALRPSLPLRPPRTNPARPPLAGVVHRPCGQRARRRHVRQRQTDADRGRGDQQVAPGSQGVHPRPGRRRPPHPLPRLQADGGPPRLVHRQHGPHSHDCQRLPFLPFVRAHPQHTPVSPPSAALCVSCACTATTKLLPPATSKSRWRKAPRLLRRYADRVKELRKDINHRTPSLVTPGQMEGNQRAIQPPKRNAITPPRSRTPPRSTDVTPPRSRTPPRVSRPGVGDSDPSARGAPFRPRTPR